MGLDQAIRKLTPELAAKIRARQAADWDRLGDEDIEQYELTHAEYDSMEELWVGRKENHIQRAIEEVTGEQIENCDYLFLSKDQVQDLVNRLRKVHEDHSLAELLLPPQDGFFFGGTELNEWYFKDIEAELLDFQMILDEWDEAGHYAYWAWW